MSNQTITNINDLAAMLGADPNEESIRRRVYKDTDCGASISVDETGVQLGSIVEGSDVEIEASFLAFPFTSDDYDDAIQYVEGEAEREWLLANGEPEEASE